MTRPISEAAKRKAVQAVNELIDFELRVIDVDWEFHWCTAFARHLDEVSELAEQVESIFGSAGIMGVVRTRLRGLILPDEPDEFADIIKLIIGGGDGYAKVQAVSLRAEMEKRGLKIVKEDQ